jgi:signal transduction histidine kinase
MPAAFGRTHGRAGVLTDEERRASSMTTSTKLWIGFGALTGLLVMLVAAIIVRLQSVEAHIRTQSDVARPRFGATREIEINVMRFALALRTFSQTRDPHQQELALEHAGNVERHLADYRRLAATAAQREMADRFAERWNEYRGLGDRAFEWRVQRFTREDGQRMSVLRAEIETLLDGRMQPEAIAAFDARKESTFDDLNGVVAFAIALSSFGVVIAILTSWIVGRGVVRAERALRDADRRKDEFLATLAHELRNPLAPLHNGISILKLSVFGDEGAAPQALAMMERQLNHMVRLIDDLLDVGRINCGKLELQMQRVDLTTILQNAIETSRPHLDANGQRLEVRLPSTPYVLDADADRLAQAFGNLLHNAAKFMDRGGCVSVAVGSVDGDAVVTIKDEGIGIAAEMLSRVFDPFAQGPAAMHGAEGGLGLGLTLVRRLVELHGGSVEAKSDGLDRGSEFVVRLPLAAPSASLPPAPSDESASSANAKRKILVADDNIDAAGSLAEVLEYMGNEVRTASDGVQALEEAEAFRPDVVLLDLGMPRMNGYDACRRLREQPWGRDIPVIAITGWGQDEDRRLSREAGFNVHLVKPVPARAISKVIDELDPVGAPH